MSSLITFRIENTGDGSPSLRLQNSDGFGEAMHNLKGAFSETVHIYLPLIEKCFSWCLSETRFLSVGLGLGYNELFTAAKALSQLTVNKKAAWRMLSFEKEAVLRDQFMAWLRALPRPTSPTPHLFEIYEQINGLIARYTGQDPFAIKEELSKGYKEGRWIIEADLHLMQKFPFRSHGIFYDAFSSQTSPELWTESFLKDFLLKASDFPCCFSTYAATGALKRSLKNSGFVPHILSGYGGKRQNTLAIRASIECSPC